MRFLILGFGKIGEAIADYLQKYEVGIVDSNEEALKKAKKKAKTNFCDLGGNDTIVDKELSLHEEAEKQEITILPDCGLAPGLADVLAAFAYSENCREIRMNKKF
ncbi:MAG: hypothetical protein B5M53_12335 [Candidatus Cloacimonas sp. 4484_209]|nr:MAG: hypothetical protein B5M53_12335 [Candidatus Cloacimonas sp. 4484_209]